MSQNREPQFLGFLRRAVFLNLFLKFFYYFSLYRVFLEEQERNKDFLPQRLFNTSFQGIHQCLGVCPHPKFKNSNFSLPAPLRKNTTSFTTHYCFGGSNKYRQTFQVFITFFSPVTLSFCHIIFINKITTLASRLFRTVSSLSGLCFIKVWRVDMGQGPSCLKLILQMSPEQPD